jgi:hypothetical protein
MSHLVNAFENIPLRDCHTRLKAAHRALTEHARRAVEQAFSVNDSAWGTRMKRLVVEVPENAVGLRAHAHNLVEVVNQCATMERLLDAMEWALTEGGMHDAKVLCCHPTTSSGESQNDLMLELIDGSRANFEVSDVVGAKDTNRKEQKDLASLMRSRASAASRSFLVTSAELGQRLAKKHSVVHAGATTFVLEVFAHLGVER